jgi:cell division protein FtsW (lipid II flippase)
VSIAIGLTFFVQMLMYVIFNLGLLITQTSLPFISSGNLVMVINMGLLGFLLSVFRTGEVVSDRAISHNLKKIS